MTLPLGEIVLIRIQFHQTAGAKIRPAAVVLDTGDDDFVAAPITSQPKHSEFDMAIGEWRTAGLNVPSAIRIHKLTVLSKSDVVRRLGTLPEADRGSLFRVLCRAFCPSP